MFLVEGRVLHLLKLLCRHLMGELGLSCGPKGAPRPLETSACLCQLLGCQRSRWVTRL